VATVVAAMPRGLSARCGEVVGAPVVSNRDAANLTRDPDARAPGAVGEDPDHEERFPFESGGLSRRMATGRRKADCAASVAALR
jgi:hypothetical protein